MFFNIWRMKKWIWYIPVEFYKIEKSETRNFVLPVCLAQARNDRAFVMTPLVRPEHTVNFHYILNIFFRCAASFSEKQHQNERIESVHEGKKHCKCITFMVQFYSQSYSLGILNQFMKGLETSKCINCVANFSIKRNLNKHIESVLDDKKLLVVIALI